MPSLKNRFLIECPFAVGEAACVDGGFAQCVGGSFVVSQCSGDLQCFALPLVNSPGTSITCTTAADAEARISASGATGGITGNGSATPAPAPAPAPVPAPVPAPKGNAGGAADGDFKAQNGRDAQRQNAEFATLNADSPCTGQSSIFSSIFASDVANRIYKQLAKAPALTMASLSASTAPSSCSSAPAPSSASLFPWSTRLERASPVPRPLTPRLVSLPLVLNKGLRSSGSFDH